MTAVVDDIVHRGHGGRLAADAGGVNDAIPKSVLGKCFAILDSVAASRELTLAEICRLTGVPKSTAYRLSKQLCAWEALDERNGRFSIGIRMFEMGRSMPRPNLLRDLVLPYILDLHEATRQAVSLDILAGRDVLCVERTVGHRSATVQPALGRRRPMHSTASGKALLAFASKAFVEQTLAGPLAARTPYTTTAPDLLLEQLASVRTTGIATDHQECHLGISSVASPIRHPDGRAIAAISVATRSRQFQPDSLGAAVRATATAVSQIVATRDPWSLRLRALTEDAH
ncbi:IclR family transcriptional regulator [Mycobacterium sp. CVI_P3]|uniref:IclR family transcriptional regulator n=1 Tax=Mycobacterium pinniadriaticum TaxID=2994102 RepID=A0ABT3SPA5_9MYCO|nr:IclR family transcriptional regulator [Mycobacterium pinniadriaticum]MCX2934272.1 IclR family transcriptional regulator [Mycobacterium pinniadriaticum]MCX2940690.1 IclR family transcriptional regulator [Mycobacterium pinniadriaticum]